MGGFRVFSLGNIPVHISPWFILILLFWLSGGDVLAGVIWGVAVTFSILVHELGHALVAKRFKLGPSILLHGLGGLTYHQPAARDRDDALIVAAGPAAGLLLGCLVWAFAASGIELGTTQKARAIQYFAVEQLLYINFFWSFVNLLPMFPLDGGLLFRLGMLRLLKPATAEKVTHSVGLGLAVGCGMVAYQLGGSHRFLFIILAIWIGLDNLRVLQGERQGPAVRIENKRAKDLLKAARAAYDAQDFREAARLCQQIRAEQNLTNEVLTEVWAILGVSSARLGEHESALRYLKRAQPRPEVVEATIECLHMLDRNEELRALLDSDDFKRIPRNRRDQILAVLHEA